MFNINKVAIDSVKMLKNITFEARKLMLDLSGASGLEYAFIAAGVSIAGIAGFALLGDQLALTFGNVAELISADSSAGQTGGSGSDGVGSSAGVGTSGGAGGSGGC